MKINLFPQLKLTVSETFPFQNFEIFLVMGLLSIVMVKPRSLFVPSSPMDFPEKKINSNFNSKHFLLLQALARFFSKKQDHGALKKKIMHISKK